MDYSGIIQIKKKSNIFYILSSIASLNCPLRQPTRCGRTKTTNYSQQLIMKFFIDTADLEEIREARDLGVLDGVTTNPSLCAKIGVADFEGHIAKICNMIEGDVAAEVVSTEYDEIMAEARPLSRIAENVVVKVPLIKEGIKAIRSLSDEGIRTNCTLCFSATQALVAAKAGTTYISPFIGRLDDISDNGMQLIEDIVTIYDNYEYETEVLRSEEHTSELQSRGHLVCRLLLE